MLETFSQANQVNSSGMTVKKLLITGAASGIGRAVAKWADAQGGYSLLLVDRDEAGVFSLISEVSCETMPLVGDVSSEDFWGSDVLRESVKGLQAAAFCAGVSDASPISEMHFDSWRRIQAINLDGVFLGLRACLPALETGGAVAAVSSATARKTVSGTAAYGASKAALEQLIRVAAIEMASKGVTVNAVAPGGVKTPMFSSQDWFRSMVADKGSEDKAWQALAALTPTERFSDPEEVADLIGFLLGPSARNITGAVLACDGGYSAE